MKTTFLNSICRICPLLLFMFMAACDDENQDEAVTCLPTELHADEALMKLTYNNQDQVEFIEYDAYDDPQTSVFKAVYTYSNDKISAIDYLEGTLRLGYKSFNYTDKTIVESYFTRISTTNDFEKREEIIYYIENGRITISASQKINSTDYDSIVFTYDVKGNIIQTESFDENKVKHYTLNLEYDDKINPYKIANVNGGDDGYFSIQNLTANNVIKAIFKVVGTDAPETQIVTYTYDAEGRPLTLKFSDDPETRAFKYLCE